MTLKSKKNVVWLLVLILLLVGVGIAVNRQLEKKARERADAERTLQMKQNKENRRLFNAQTMRIERVMGRVFIADGTEQIQLAIVSDACDKIRAQHGITVLPEDIAMWLDEPEVKLILTADELYLIQNGVVLYWRLAELTNIDWERETNGDIFIGGTRYHFLVDCRRPFVEAIKKIVANCKQAAVE